MLLADLINTLKRERNLSWRQVGEIIGISGALAWRVGHGKSDSTVARDYFGLPPKSVEVVPCRCGEVHSLKTCPHKRKRKPKKYTVAFKFECSEDAAAFRQLIGSDRVAWALDIIDENTNCL